MKVLVKICGLTNAEDAQMAVDCGANFLGFVMVPGTPRYIEPERVREIVDSLPVHVLKVGVFQNAKARDLKRALLDCRIDIAQLHGNESMAMARALGPERIWKAFCLETSKDVEKAIKFPSAALLVDSVAGRRRGGTGKVANWKLAGELAKERRIVLAGGLTPKNVLKAIKTVRPHTVDVSSGVESEPGKKDPVLVKKFIDAVHSTMS